MKQPSWKTPLILSFSLFVLGGFAYWLEYSHKPKQEKADSAVKKPLGLPSEETQIVSFKIRGTKTNLSAKCDALAQKKCKANDATDWSLTEPAVLKGDSESIKTVLNGMTSAVAPETVDLSEETPEKKLKLLDDYGLSEAKRNAFTTPMIELTLENGKSVTMWFGIEHPLGDKAFVVSAVDGKLNDQTVFLLSDFTRSNLEHDLTYFRDKSIFNFNRSQVSHFTAKTTAGAIEASEKDNHWTVNGFESNYDRIETLLSYIAQMKAKDFPGSADILKGAKSVLNYKLDLPKESITLELFEKGVTPSKSNPKDKGAKKEPADQHFYLKTSVRPDPVEVDAYARTQLDKKVSDLRNNELFKPTELTSITHVKIEGNNFHSVMEFNQDKGKWVSITPDTHQDVTKLTALLDALNKTKIKDFISPPPAGVSIVKLTMGDGKNPAQFKWTFSQMKQKIFVRDQANTRNEAYEVGFEIKNALPLDSESWTMKK